MQTPQMSVTNNLISTFYVWLEAGGSGSQKSLDRCRSVCYFPSLLLSRVVLAHPVRKTRRWQRYAEEAPTRLRPPRLMVYLRARSYWIPGPFDITRLYIQEITHVHPHRASIFTSPRTQHLYKPLNTAPPARVLLVPDSPPLVVSRVPRAFSR
ncbi:hypothetical protein OG21DRAFT_417526 [Imleria badia]|nr:hypothetical protein OG21DRAFT_417526 [Imleria badia]